MQYFMGNNNHGYFANIRYTKSSLIKISQTNIRNDSIQTYLRFYLWKVNPTERLIEFILSQ